MKLKDTLSLHFGGPGSGRHKEVGASMLENYEDHLIERKMDGIKEKPDILQFVDHMKTNYRSNMAPEHYEKAKEEAIKMFKEKYK